MLKRILKRVKVATGVRISSYKARVIRRGVRRRAFQLDVHREADRLVLDEFAPPGS